MIVLKLILLSLITFRIGIKQHILHKEFIVYFTTNNKFVSVLYIILWLLVIFGYDVVILSKLYDTIIT